MDTATRAAVETQWGRVGEREVLPTLKEARAVSDRSLSDRKGNPAKRLLTSFQVERVGPLGPAPCFAAVIHHSIPMTMPIGRTTRAVSTEAWASCADACDSGDRCQRLGAHERGTKAKCATNRMLLHRSHTVATRARPRCLPAKYH